MKQRTLQQAEAFAKIEIAEAKKNSEIGQKERENITRQRNADLEAQSVTVENQTKQRIVESNAQLTIKNAEMLRLGEIAKIKAQKEIESAKIELMEETLRNQELAKTRVEAEVLIRKSEGDKRAIEIDSDAQFYRAKVEAESKKISADAELYSQQKLAEGTFANYQAQANGLEKMLNSLGGDTNALIKMRGIETNLYEKLAKEAGQAVKGMQPKINVWNTGSNTNDVSGILRNIVSNIPPLLDGIQSQMDISPFQKKIEEFKNV